MIAMDVASGALVTVRNAVLGRDNGRSILVADSTFILEDSHLVRANDNSGSGFGVAQFSAGLLRLSGVTFEGSFNFQEAMVSISGRATIDDCAFINNNGFGSILDASGIADVAITNSRFTGNVGPTIIDARSQNLSMTNVTVVGNRSTSDRGVVSLRGDSASFTNVIVARNVGGGVYAPFTLAPLYAVDADFHHSVVWGNTSLAGQPADFTGATVIAGVVHTWDPEVIASVLSVDPGFVSTSGPPSTWDVHLAPGSPLINAGTPALRNPDGSVSDIGAWGGPGADWSYYCDRPGSYGAVYDLSGCPF